MQDALPEHTSAPLLAWELPAGMLVALVVALLVLRYGLLGWLRKRAERTITRWDNVLVDVLAGVRPLLIVPALIYAATRGLFLPPWLDRALHILSVTCLAIQALLILRVLINVGLDELDRRARRGSADAREGLSSSLAVLRVMAFGIATALIVLAALDNAGVSITSLIAGLGIGGVAVALAVQNILGDLFGSLSIILDKPFVVGDFIVAGNQMGTVERIGIKTTRVRALGGEQLVFSNRDLLDSRIQNFKRMQERRVLFTFWVAYRNADAGLNEVTSIVKRAITDQQRTRFDRCHLKELGDYALVFECVYFVLTPEYNDYMDIHQAIIRQMMEQFRKHGIRLAVRRLTYAA